MRKLVLVRGAPGSGKSTMLRREAGMDGHILASDDVRLLMGAPVMWPSGSIGVDQAFNQRIIPMMKGIFRERVGRGETIAVDMVNESPADIDLFLDIARDANYEALLVDFGDKPLQDCLEGNRARDEWRVVPEFVVERMHASIAGQHVPERDGLKVVRWSPDGSHLKAVRDFLSVPVLDLSRFRAVVHIGDIQGCFTVLAGPDGPLGKGLDPDVAYVFVGDLLDRGIENGEVLRWFLDACAGRDNVFLLYGNHEEHIVRWATGQSHVSAEFQHRTLPQLLQSGLQPSDALPIVRMAREVLFYEWNGHKVLVNHAGLPTVPRRPAMISLAQYSGGVGKYEDDMDAAFDRLAPEGWVQVHGHRNHHDLPTQASRRSFNLESKVEFGGSLRLATLDGRGWTTQQFRNHVYAPAAERRVIKDKTAAPWVGRPDAGATISPDTIATLRAHSGVRAKKAGRAFPNIESFAFTREVFYDKSWDDVVVKARGLFVDTSGTVEGPNGEQGFAVAARGYPKFFNAHERPETDPEVWAANVTFPVTGYLKDNGFLGVLGIDPATNDLFVASKSTAEGPFAGWFREILESSLSPDRLDRVRRWLVDNDACMAFEVIDPVNDPHIVEYDAKGLVLLDVFRRAEAMERLPYEHLQMVGERLGFSVKQKMVHLPTKEAFLGFLKRMNQPGATWKGAMIEGVVFEDQCGEMLKLKAPDYAFWKRMRSAKERLLAYREGRGGYEVERYFGDPRAGDFLQWLGRLPNEELAKDIISLRKAYQGRDLEAGLEEVEGPRP